MVRLLVLSAILVLFIGLYPAKGQDKSMPHNPPPPEKTVEQVKKNIKVLTGMPVSQLTPTMDYFAMSLGVRCDFCHSSDTAGHTDFASDEKSEKKTAREMITMVKDLNENHFNGKIAVTCYTCHHGANEPMRNPELPIAMKAHEENEDAHRPELPKTDQVLAAYEKALGGADAMGKIKTRIVKAVLTRGENQNSLDIVQAAPGRYAGSVTNEGQIFTNVVDGKEGWSTSSRGARPLSDAELTRISREASMFPLQHLKDMGENLRIRGTDTVNGKTAYVLVARIGDNLMERYYIDSATSLLTRRNVMNKTMLAWLPDQCDYSDFREIDGVKIPFVERYSYVNSRANSVHKFTEVKQNVSIDEKLFTKPEMKPMEGRDKK